MFENRLQLVKNLMHIMHITLDLCASTASIHFKFGFAFYILYVCFFFIIFWGFPKVNSWAFFITEWQHWLPLEDVHSRVCFHGVLYDSQLWTLWIGVRESNVRIRYRRMARLLKKVSSIQFVKLNTNMADNRFGGVVLKRSRIGNVDTRI